MDGHSQTYVRYMKSDQWRKKRLERLQLDDFTCCMCGRPAASCKHGLQVHHISYKNLTNEDVYSDLVSLCPRCHILIHNFMQRRQTK